FLSLQSVQCCDLNHYAYRFFFFFYSNFSSDSHRDLHSFPTRRSSDLLFRCTFEPRHEIVHDLCCGLGLSDTSRCLTHRAEPLFVDRKSTRLNSSHVKISYAVFCLKKKKKNIHTHMPLQK